MSPSMPIQHFTHIHPLTKLNSHGFICNGCNTYGFGTTYRCVSCDYDLHDHCATCPPTLLSFMHPQHELQRVFRGPDQSQHNKRTCNICDQYVEGLYYHCEPCGFDVHPLCTQLPQHVRYLPHPDHHLELSNSGASNMCEVCHRAIRSWRYKCCLCRFDVHMECVKLSPSAGAATQERYIASQQQFHHSQYNQSYNTQFHHPQIYQPYNTQFHHSQYNQPYNTQLYHPQYNQPYNTHLNHPQYYQPDFTQFHHQPYTNQGQFQPSNPSTGLRMFEIVMTLTAEIVNHIIDGPFYDGSSSDASGGTGSNDPGGQGSDAPGGHHRF